MQKYNKLIENITDLIEKGLLTSNDLKKDAEEALKFRIEILVNKLNLVSREEFEVQKKLYEKLNNEIEILKKAPKIRTLRKFPKIRKHFKIIKKLKVRKLKI